MDGGVMAEDTVTDFAVAAYREDGDWEVAPLPLRAAADLDSLVAALRQLPAETGALALVSVADDFFLAVRVRGARVLVLLSDATAADEWPIAQEAIDMLGLEVPDDSVEADPGPIGDLDLAADLGLPAFELDEICADTEAYPDELLGRVATRLGFGPQFDRALDGTL